MRWPATEGHITGLPEAFAFACGPYLLAAPVVLDLVPLRWPMEWPPFFHLSIIVLSFPEMSKALHCDSVLSKSRKVGRFMEGSVWRPILWRTSDITKLFLVQSYSGISEYFRVLRHFRMGGGGGGIIKLFHVVWSRRAL